MCFDVRRARSTEQYGALPPVSHLAVGERAGPNACKATQQRQEVLNTADEGRGLRKPRLFTDTYTGRRERQQIPGETFLPARRKANANKSEEKLCAVRGCHIQNRAPKKRLASSRRWRHTSSMRLFYTFMDPVNDVSSMSPWTLYMRSCRIDRKQKHSADVVLWKTENGGHMEAERSRLEVGAPHEKNKEQKQSGNHSY